MRLTRLLRVAWPAFLSACLLQMIVFAVVDPAELHLRWGQEGSAWSRQAVYALAFFLFWAGAALAAAMTVLLERRGEEEGR